jgi:hypothetical protein
MAANLSRPAVSSGPFVCKKAVFAMAPRTAEGAEAHDVAVLAALAVLDPDDHAAAVDVVNRDPNEIRPGRVQPDTDRVD